MRFRGKSKNSTIRLLRYVRGVVAKKQTLRDKANSGRREIVAGKQKQDEKATTRRRHRCFPHEAGAL